MPASDRTPPAPRIRVVAGAVIRGEQVLVARRPRGSQRGNLWELPGGKVAPGENDGQALLRELEEELGIQVAITGLLGGSDYDYPDVSIRLVGLSCRLVSGEPIAREHAEIRWLGSPDLQALDWAPADIPLLEPLRALLSS
jgi:8-oxo-dGTP diphosphatase